MKTFLRNLLLSFLLLTFAILPFKALAMENSIFSDNTCNKAACDLRMAERRLWIDHVSWTRSYIISALASLEDKDDVAQRLLRNQDDIGNSIKPIYGEEAGNTLTKLLREHIELAAKVVDAAKNENKADLDKYNKLWYENADEIADFLSSINPSYSNKTLKEMLHKHLQLITDQVIARLNKDWKADISAYDKGEEHMINFADILIDGIIKQFPEKFK